MGVLRGRRRSECLNKRSKDIKSSSESKSTFQFVTKSQYINSLKGTYQNKQNPVLEELLWNKLIKRYFFYDNFNR